MSGNDGKVSAIIDKNESSNNNNNSNDNCNKNNAKCNNNHHQQQQLQLSKCFLDASNCDWKLPKCINYTPR